VTGFFRIIGHFVRRLLGKGRAGESGPMDSVVILFDKSMAFSDSQIMDAVRRAFPLNTPKSLPNNTMPPPPYAPDASPARLVPFAIDRRVFGLLFGQFQYTDISLRDNDPARASSTVAAFADHRSWVAVDFVTGPQPDDIYGYLGHIAAELVTPDATLIFLPALSLAAHPSPDLVEAMRIGKWIDHLEVLLPPILHQRPADDAALAAATTEAREKFADFTEAFQQNNGTDFSVKFPFIEGDEIEHMWVAVESINDNQVFGTLGNQPGVISNIGEGDPVTRSLDDMEDWLYMDGQNMVGGFSVRAMLKDGNGA
jgi:uncharacterized protein YegJ (DUF2314 family)